MNNKERKVIFTIMAIMVVILLILVVLKSTGKEKTQTETELNNTIENEEKYVTTLSDGTKLNNSSELNKTKTYKTMSISGIQFTNKNGSSVLLAELTNTGSTTFAREVVIITILGENGDIIDTVEGVIPETVAGKTSELNVIITADIVNAKDFTIVAKY